MKAAGARQPRTKNARGTVTTLDIVGAMLADGDDAQSLSVTLPLAERELAELVERGFNDCVVEELAGRISAEANGDFWTDADARVERIKLGELTTLTADDASAVSKCGYMTAGGAFALGLVAGMRLGGAAR